MKLIAEHFEPLVGNDLIVHLDDGTEFPLTLTKVSPAGSVTEQGDDDTPTGHRMFTLDLVGPRDAVIESLTYPITAPGIPDETFLFVSAHAQDEDGTHYNIVVS